MSFWIYLQKQQPTETHPCSWTNADTSEWQAANFLTSAPPLALPFWFSSFCWQQTIKHCSRKREVLFMRGLLFKQRQTPRQPPQHYSLAFNGACRGATFPSWSKLVELAERQVELSQSGQLMQGPRFTVFYAKVVLHKAQPTNPIRKVFPIQLKLVTKM